MENQNKYNHPILEIRNVSKDFSGVYALKNIDMQIFQGEVNAIIGENGAGKSTLMKIISGVYSDFEGEILLSEVPVKFKNSKVAADNGVIIIHQELNLIPYLSITSNLFLGNEIINKFGLLDIQAMRKKAKELLSRLHMNIDPDAPVNQLRVGQQQMVEIAKALLLNSKVLIMDEPTSAISNHEVELLFRIINDLKAKGVAIVYISHKMKELFEIADRFTVLRDGEKISTGLMKDVEPHELVKMMVGRTLTENLSNLCKTHGEELLRVEKLSLRNPDNKSDFLVQNISFSLHKGEVLGISGLMGAGRTEVLEAIFGLYPKHITGSIYLKGEKKNFKTVSDAIAAGIALVPEDRKLQGLILNMNVAKNISLANLKRVLKFIFISKKKEVGLSREFIRKLNTQVASSDMEVEKLSGGNQQKVVIAKWLATNPVVLMLDEPTRGIDIGSKNEIYKLINELAEQGIGIVMVSSELPEILAVSDRILVMSESVQTALIDRSEASEEIIMHAALSRKE